MSQIGALQPNAAGMYDAAALAAVVEMGQILQSGAGATLEDLATRIRPSVMLVIAE